MFCEGQNVVFKKVKCVILASSKINLNMQEKKKKGRSSICKDDMVQRVNQC